MSLLLAFAVMALQQGSRQIEGLPNLAYGDAYLPGQREVIVGAKPYPDTVMALQFSREYKLPLGGYGTLWDEHAEGYVRWSLQKNELNGNPCLLLKTEGVTKRKFVGNIIALQQIRNYWLDQQGRILKQYDLLSDPSGYRSATSEYQEEAVEITTADSKGAPVKTTMYTGPAMARLQAQFQPMVEGNKVTQSTKRFAVLNPFDRTFEEFQVKAANIFSGRYMDLPFHGRSFEITGPSARQLAFISDEAELVKVELPKSRSLVLTTAPPSKADGHWKVDVPSKGGGG